MATRKYLINDLSPQETPLAIEDRELIIAITPRDETKWKGTAAQILGEGLIPEGLEWPKGQCKKHWHSNGFSYCLERCRPDGIKGPMSVWVHGDWWMLRRTLTADTDCYQAGKIFELRCAYERRLWEQTPAAQIEWKKKIKAIQDEAYQVFRLKATGGLDRARRLSRSK